MTLTEREGRFLRAARARQRYLLIAGLLLVLAGGSYAYWGVKQAQDERAGVEQAGFDRPIARLAGLLARYRARLDQVQPDTRLEKRLLSELKAQTDLFARWVVLTFRALLGFVVVGVGVALVAVALTERQYLSIAEKLGRVT